MNDKQQFDLKIKYNYHKMIKMILSRIERLPGMTSGGTTKLIQDTTTKRPKTIRYV